MDDDEIFATVMNNIEEIKVRTNMMMVKKGKFSQKEKLL